MSTVGRFLSPILRRGVAGPLLIFSLPAMVSVYASLSMGCLTPKRIEPLGDAVRGYNEAVRWERFEMAAARVPPTRRDDFLDERDTLREDLRINGYDVVRIRKDKTGRRAKVHLKYTWYLDSKGVVHKTHTVQRWERASSSWLLLSEQYLRGEPMPGITDPDEPLHDDDDDHDDPPDVQPDSGPDNTNDPASAEHPATNLDVSGSP